MYGIYGIQGIQGGDDRQGVITRHPSPPALCSGGIPSEGGTGCHSVSKGVTPGRASEEKTQDSEESKDVADLRGVWDANFILTQRSLWISVVQYSHARQGSKFFGLSDRLSSSVADTVDFWYRATSGTSVGVWGVEFVSD